MDASRHQQNGGGGPFLRRKKLVAIVPLICVGMIALLIAAYFSPLNFLNSAHASDTSLVKLPGQTPALARGSALQGSLDPNTQLTVSVGLRLRNQDGLARYIQSVSQTKGRVKRTLTPDQITRAYAPLPTSEQAVIDYMAQYGVHPSQTYKNHILVTFQGTAAQFEQAFHVQLNTYRGPDGQTFYAPDTDPSVSSTIAPFVQSIAGLDSEYHRTHAPIQKNPVKTKSNSVISASTTCLPDSQPGGNYYTPGQIAKAYNITGLHNQGFNGEGQAVALVEFSTYSSSDIQAYTSCYGGSKVPIKKISVNGGTTDTSGQVEVTLDMDLILSAAPHLANLRVYEAPNSDAGDLAMWAAIVNDAVPSVSTSWGSCEYNTSSAVLEQENSLFMLAAAQGQSIFAASGDDGSRNQFQSGIQYCTPVNGNPPPSLSVQDPSSQPYVTGVGGTTLNAYDGYSSETAWNSTFFGGQSGATGGGISSIWHMPSWQQGPGVNNSYTSGTPCGNTSGNCREVPDVSLSADPNNGYLISFQGSWGVVGGTSCAAPMWAAFTALANQKSLHDGYFNLGFLNPMLYQIGQNSSEYSNDFHDITTGNNNMTGGPEYPATSNYDMATGLGSFNAANLASDLVAIAGTTTGPRQSPASTDWYFAEGAVGGSDSEFITVLNPSATQAATVTVNYLFESKPSVQKTYTVNPNTRFTISANNDLGISKSATPGVSISVFLHSSIPVVAERPMYFNAFGVPSGTDVLGATSTQTSFYFANGDARQGSGHFYATFITMLNPSTSQTANVTINYIANGGIVKSQTLAIGPMKRGTASPTNVGINQQVAIQVTSDLPIVAERPMYVRDTIANAGGYTTGAASAVGATAPGTDWLFAEGSTAKNFQEYLVLANFSNTDATATVKLEYKVSGGCYQTFTVPVKAMSQAYVDVNNATAHPQNLTPSTCSPTTDVSADVSSDQPIVAERLIYFHFGKANLSGITDVVGLPAARAAFSFAEGSSSNNFSEFITLQNPNSKSVTVVVTFYADNTVVQREITLSANSRQTVDVNQTVLPMINAYHGSNDVSVNVQTLDGSKIVAERPLYFNFFGSVGGTDVIGFTG